MIPTTDFLGYQVLNYSMQDIDFLTDYFLSLNRPIIFTVINANKIFLADRNPRLQNFMKNSDLLLPEQAIVIGSRWLGKPLKGRVSGIEFMEYILNNAENRQYKIFIYGAKKEVGQTLIHKYQKKYPKIKFVGYIHGYNNDNDYIISQINIVKPDFLFVALGSPRQEFWIEENINKINVKIVIGVGGSIDVLSGMKKRAPKWTQHGFEWLYRALQDWHRIDLWKRYLITNPYFIFRVLRFKFGEAKG